MQIMLTSWYYTNAFVVVAVDLVWERSFESDSDSWLAAT